MRGQSYDNAANMLGKYNGPASAQEKKTQQLAEYIPCSGHSLNLVGTKAADCCLRATSFFMFVQKLYVFLRASTSRWAKVVSLVKESETKKNYFQKDLIRLDGLLSGTR